MGRAGGMVGLASLVAITCLGMDVPSAQAQAPGGTAPVHIGHVRFTPINVHDPVNVQHVNMLRARVPRKCGAEEVAPNVWVRVECHTYAPITGIKKIVFTSSRMRMLKTGMARLDPKHSAVPVPKPGGDKAGTPVPAGGGGGDRAASSDADFPDTVDHRKNGTEGPIKNQEYTSMCTGFSLSSTIDNGILRLGGSDVSSPTHLWAHYGSPHMTSAASGNMNKPIAVWQTWPFSPKEGCELSRFEDDCADHYGVSTNSADRDARIQTELRAADGAGKYKLTSIEALSIPANPDEVAAVLATGADLWVAFSLDINHWGYRTLQNNANQITDWTDPEGGHAVMLAGYRTKSDGTKQFLIHNSWGTDWGDGGYAWISEKMVSKFMHAAYKVKVESIGPPPSPLTDDDCDMDELVDAVTGKCAATCDDDSRPSNGCASTGAKAPPPASCPAGTALVNGTCKPLHVFNFRH